MWCVCECTSILKWLMIRHIFGQIIARSRVLLSLKRESRESRVASRALCWMRGRMDEWMDGWMVGWLNRWMTRWLLTSALLYIYMNPDHTHTHTHRSYMWHTHQATSTLIRTNDAIDRRQLIGRVSYSQIPSPKFSSFSQTIYIRVFFWSNLHLYQVNQFKICNWRYMLYYQLCATISVPKTEPEPNFKPNIKYASFKIK